MTIHWVLKPPKVFVAAFQKCLKGHRCSFYHYATKLFFQKAVPNSSMNNYMIYPRSSTTSASSTSLARRSPRRTRRTASPISKAAIGSNVCARTRAYPPIHSLGRPWGSSSFESFCYRRKVLFKKKCFCWKDSFDISVKKTMFYVFLDDQNGTQGQTQLVRSEVRPPLTAICENYRVPCTRKADT